MVNPRQLRCFVMGEGSLLIQCAQCLMDHNYQILGMIASDSLAVQWALNAAIPIVQPNASLKAVLSQQPFDYLFSIANSIILSEDLLNLPQRYAINYHDSPLPRYAGLHAPAWALLNQESQHAITWHVMRPKLDAGEILKQVPVTVAPTDTALTLNLKSYEAAVASFQALINELATGTETYTPQVLAQRSYVSRRHKPASGIQFHWQRSAEDLEALVRGLSFAPLVNPIGLPKLPFNHPVVVSKLKVLDQPSRCLPGTIVAIYPDAVQVASQTHDVLLQKCQTLQGQPLSLPQFLAQVGLKAGDQLPDLRIEQAAQIDRFDSSIVSQESYWVQRLQALQPIPLPAAWQSGGSQPGATEYKVSELHPDTIAALQHLALDLSVGNSSGNLISNSIGTVLMAAFAAYLYRVGEHNCFDIGFTHPTLQAEVANLAGYFAAHVPCRIAISPEQGFRQVAATVAEQVEQVQRRKTFTSDLVARYPQLASQEQLRAANPLAIGCQQVNQLEDFQPPPTVGAALTCILPADGRGCGWCYDPATIETQRIEQIAAQFTDFLQELLVDPDRGLADVQLPPLQRLSDLEQHQILVAWNATEIEYPMHLRLHDLFEAQVEQAPDAVAVVFEGQALTYCELNHRANQVAHRLQALGVQPEVTVGICIERSLEMVVGLLGILKAGGAYVPLDPSYPSDRLAHILTDANPAAVLTLEKFRPLLDAAIPTVCLDTDWPTISAESAENPASPATADHLAYIIYTSGSTGKPKGVLIEHRGAVNTILDINRRFAVGAVDRGLAVCSLNFDLSVYDVFGMLAAGGAIILPKPAIAPEVDEWVRLMHQEQVTLWNSAPPVMQMVAGQLQDRDRAELDGATCRLPSSLRLVMLSGDWIPLTLPDLIRQLKVGETPVEIISLGGATEVSIWSILHPVGAIDPSWKSIPYGKPMANQQFYILDQQLQPVPVGEVGELFIGGDGVARGYHNRPDLNAKKFLPDPFRTTATGRLYRTGDLGRYWADGTIEFLGRIDHQVKIRGFRVELGEIEAVLAQYPNLRETAILMRDDGGEKRLVAYLVPQQGAAEQPRDLLEAIRQFLKAKLPNYMVPSAFVLLESLPLTPNGKLDRTALPAPDAANLDIQSAFVPPRDELEQQLVQIWQDCLEMQPIGITDNFFALGGHSLLAVRLWTHVEKTFSTTLPLATLFQAPTIQELGECLRQAKPTTNCPSLVIIQPGEPTAAKRALFCIHVLGRGLKFYRPLLRYLDPDQPIYGLSTNIAGEDFPSKSVENLAAHYVQQIRTLQPTGPYLLIGASFGGMVAFEMAQQLQAQGQSVDFLGLLDTRLPTAELSVPVVQQLEEHWRHFAHLGPGYILQKMQERGIGQTQRLTDLLQAQYNNLSIQFYETLGQPLPERLQDFMYEQQNTELGDAYQPRKYTGKVTLFRASEESVKNVRVHIADDLGWGQFAGSELETIPVPGTHLGMLQEPNVRVLGQYLRRCITRVTPKPPRSAVDTRAITSSYGEPGLSNSMNSLVYPIPLAPEPATLVE